MLPIAKNARPEVRNTIDRAQSFLGLTALLAAVLAGVAIALGTRRFVERHLDGCPTCRAEAESFAETWLLLGAIDSPAPDSARMRARLDVIVDAHEHGRASAWRVQRHLMLTAADGNRFSLFSEFHICGAVPSNIRPQPMANNVSPQKTAFPSSLNKAIWPVVCPGTSIVLKVIVPNLSALRNLLPISR